MIFSLFACDERGVPVESTPELPEALVMNCLATAERYGRIGFEPPWVGYVAVVDNRAVGSGAFVGPPKDGVVEIAYYTLENECGKG